MVQAHTRVAALARASGKIGRIVTLERMRGLQGHQLIGKYGRVVASMAQAGPVELAITSVQSFIYNNVEICELRFQQYLLYIRRCKMPLTRQIRGFILDSVKRYRTKEKYS